MNCMENHSVWMYSIIHYIRHSSGLTGGQFWIKNWIGNLQIDELIPNYI